MSLPKNESKELAAIREASGNEITSFSQLAEASALKYRRMMYILDHHPVVKARLAQMFVQNKTLKKSSSIENPEEENVAPLPSRKKIVLDTSVCASPSILKVLYHECTEKNAIVYLTDITIFELEKLEDGDDNSAYRARRILHSARVYTESYTAVDIEKTSDNPDDNIVEFAASLKDAVLFTADKAMSLKAKIKGVSTRFFTAKNNYTLRNVYFSGKKHLVDIGRQSDGSVVVAKKMNDYYCFENNTAVLENNDEVIIFTEHSGCVKMMHFRIKIDGNTHHSILVNKLFLKGTVPTRYQEPYDLFLINRESLFIKKKNFRGSGT